MYLVIVYSWSIHKNILQEAQGYTRSKRNSRLVYDFTDCSQGAGSNQQKSPLKTVAGKSGAASSIQKSNERTTSGSKSSSSSPASSSRSNDSQHSKTPERQIKTTGSGASSPAVSNARMNSRFGYNGSPKSSLVQSPGSVLSKASMFESKGTTVKTKDPAEMTLSERKALFERNKGEALIPKAPLTMSVPTKMLQEKEKSTSNHNGGTCEILFSFSVFK